MAGRLQATSTDLRRGPIAKPPQPSRDDALPACPGPECETAAGRIGGTVHAPPVQRPQPPTATTPVDTVGGKRSRGMPTARPSGPCGCPPAAPAPWRRGDGPAVPTPRAGTKPSQVTAIHDPYIFNVSKAGGTNSYPIGNNFDGSVDRCHRFAIAGRELRRARRISGAGRSRRP